MTAQTVTGPVEAAALGFTLPHEHVIFGYPGYQGDVTLGPFDHDAALATCVQTAQAVRSRGVRTVVDATPNECGRDPAFLREVSLASGLHILCSTGYYLTDDILPALERRGITQAQIEQMTVLNPARMFG